MKFHNIFKSDQDEPDVNSYHTTVENKIKEVISPLHKFINTQVIAGLFLLFSTVLALFLATYTYTGSFYKDLIHTPIGIRIGDWVGITDIKFWVNDVLLTFFFFVIGLEIKREFLVGELRDIRKSFLIIIAAAGGMLIPALIFSIFNYGTEYSSGFGIPVATDTAFAIGALSLFKNKLPKEIFTFIIALAIIDDIGAILLLAAFYTHDINSIYLLFALIAVIALGVINFCGAKKPLPYFLIGFVVWAMIEKAGIHGAISGVIIAATIPSRPQLGPNKAISKISELIKYFEQRQQKNALILDDPKQHNAVQNIKQVATQASTSLQRWEGKLDTPVSIVVLPLFAFFNAGVALSASSLADAFSNSLSLGIICGLFIGKPLGITLFCYLSTIFGSFRLPLNITLKDVFTASLFCGIGFTMSIFVADINFDHNVKLLETSKIAILIGSLLSATAGSILTLRLRAKNDDAVIA